VKKIISHLIMAILLGFFYFKLLDLIRFSMMKVHVDLLQKIDLFGDFLPMLLFYILYVFYFFNKKNERIKYFIILLLLSGFSAITYLTIKLLLSFSISEF